MFRFRGSFSCGKFGPQAIVEFYETFADGIAVAIVQMGGFLEFARRFENVADCQDVVVFFFEYLSGIERVKAAGFLCKLIVGIAEGFEILLLGQCQVEIVWRHARQCQVYGIALRVHIAQALLQGLDAARHALGFCGGKIDLFSGHVYISLLILLESIVAEFYGKVQVLTNLLQYYSRRYGRYVMITIENLTKKFPHKTKAGKNSEKTAVDNLSLAIGAGEIFGLLGPNGAGKTTTIRMLTMQTQPTSGHIRYKDMDLAEHAQTLKSVIGVVPQHVNFDQDLTVGENLELHARLHHMRGEERRQRIRELLAYVELTDVVNDGVRRLSGGMKRRLLIARALLHRPRILFMDEPTVALDPQVRRRIWELIRQMARDGVTVFLTTHYIEEAENLCDRVAILNKGRLVALDTPENFCEQLGRYTVEWDGSAGRAYKFFAEKQAAAVFAGRQAGEGSILIRPTNLEDVFIELTGRKEGI